jgi:arginine/ornithine N-succinyltransferase beta subunit
MAILEDEGFFGERFVDSFDADQDPDTESDRDT